MSITPPTLRSTVGKCLRGGIRRAVSTLERLS